MSEITNQSTEKMTIEEFDKLPEDNSVTYELIDGIVCISPRPNNHQSIMKNLIVEISLYLKGKPCEAFTKVELEIDENVIVPDITVICNFDSLEGQRFKQPPVLVIEILSPSNTNIEMNRKMNKYKSHGIQEFWLVDPINSTIAKFNLQDSISMTYIKSGSITSTAFSDLEIKLSDVFE